jgi:hypothetical protein
MPAVSLALVLAALAVPAFALDLSPSTRRYARLYAQAFIAVTAAFGLFQAGEYLRLLRPQVQGPDFFYFLCVARDKLAGAADSALSYAYFPGAYRFFQFALRVGHGSLSGVQWTYVVVLAANAGLLGVAVFRALPSVSAALIAVVGYVALCPRIEGGYGIAEPIATLPLAAGIAVWGGEALRGRRGHVLAAALGVGLGLAAYVKQQGGLQSAGWLTLVLLNLGVERDKRHAWLSLGLVPAAAALTFAVGILVEGHGLLPLRVGLTQVGTYDVHGSLRTNLISASGKVPALVTAAELSLVCLLAIFVCSPRLRSAPWMSISVFAFGAASGTLAQFTKRAYAHYALLTAPWLLLACVLTLVALARLLPARLRESSAFPFACAFLAALPFVRTEDKASRAFFLWPIESIPPPSLGHPWLRRDMAGDIRELGRFVHRGEDVLVLPPRHNELHFLLGTRSLSFPEGYGWGGTHTKAAPRALVSQTLAAVIVLNPRSRADFDAWRDHDCEEAVASLAQTGFHRVAALRTLAVWRRD